MKKNLLLLVMLVGGLFYASNLTAQVTAVALTDGSGGNIENTTITLDDAATYNYNVTYTANAYSTQRITIAQYGPKVESSSGDAVWIQTSKVTGVAVDGADINVTGSFPIYITRVKNDVTTTAATGAGYLSIVLQTKESGSWADVGDPIQVPVSWLNPTTDIDDAQSISYSVYPNPAIENISVEAPLGAQVEVCNVTGGLVTSFVASSDVEKVSTNGLATGIYLVKIASSGKVVTQKVLVK